MRPSAEPPRTFTVRASDTALAFLVNVRLATIRAVRAPVSPALQSLPVRTGGEFFRVTRI